jgi:hypothetical protein
MGNIGKQRGEGGEGGEGRGVYVRLRRKSSAEVVMVRRWNCGLRPRS